MSKIVLITISVLFAGTFGWESEASERPKDTIIGFLEAQLGSPPQRTEIVHGYFYQITFVTIERLDMADVLDTLRADIRRLFEVNAMIDWDYLESKEPEA